MSRASDGAYRVPRDLRLVVPALCAWVTTVVLLGASASAAFLACVLAASAACAVAWTTRRRESWGAPFGRLRRAAGRRGWRAIWAGTPAAPFANVGLAALVCSAAAAGSVGLRLAAVGQGPVAALASGRRATAMQLVVTSTPRLGAPKVRRSTFHRSVIVHARAEAVVDRGQWVRVRSPVLVVATGKAWAHLVSSQRVRTRGRLVPADGGELLAAVLLARGPPAVVGPPSALESVAERFRAGLRSAARNLPGDERGLLLGLVLGDTSAMPPPLSEDFRTTGLAHLLAVSGVNAGPGYVSCWSVRAAIYTRVSSDPRGRGRSVAEQETECRRVCEREDWRVVAVFVDNDRSASRYANGDRPAYRRLVELVASGGCDALVTWEASRAQRDLAVYVKLRDLSCEAGVLWSYSGRTYDLTRTDDRFQTGLDALLAEREADQTRERVLRAVRANIEAGRPHGKIPYGYRREYDPDTGELVAQVPREDQAAVVREAFRRVAGGESCYAVAKDYNARGVPAPRGGTWDLTQIRRVVSSPIYVGRRTHKGRELDAAWPAIVDEATYQACHSRVTDPRRRTSRESAIKHLLSGLAICGVCETPLKVQKNRGWLAYLCPKGFHVSIKKEVLEGYVEAVTIERLSRPDVAELLRPEGLGEVNAAAAEVAARRARLEGFYDAAAAGELTPAALARIESRLIPEIESAEARARPRAVSPALRNAAGPDAAERWAALVITQRREVIDVLMTIRVERTVRGAHGYDPGERVRVEPRRRG